MRVFLMTPNCLGASQGWSMAASLPHYLVLQIVPRGLRPKGTGELFLLSAMGSMSVWMHLDLLKMLTTQWNGEFKCERKLKKLIVDPPPLQL